MTPKHSSSKSRAIWDLARAGNFPSVASNGLAALVLSSTAFAWPSGAELALAIAAGCLVYAGGATLNDVFDAAFDAQHRPERAIPRGVVSRRTAARIGMAELALGSGILIVAGASPTAVAGLLAAILAYNRLHKRWTGAVALMAGCRVLLAGAIATLPGHELTVAWWSWVSALFVYIVVLSLIARREYTSAQPGALTRRMSVGRLLAFIPLIDAIALLLISAWVPAMACAAAIPLGRWAQRLAAST